MLSNSANCSFLFLVLRLQYTLFKKWVWIRWQKKKIQIFIRSENLFFFPFPKILKKIQTDHTWSLTALYDSLQLSFVVFFFQFFYYWFFFITYGLHKKWWANKSCLLYTAERKEELLTINYKDGGWTTKTIESCSCSPHCC